MVRGLLLILFFYWLGEVVSRLINGFIPGSVIGMLALFSCLMMRWIKPEQVRETAKTMTGSMAIFLIPSSVGIMMYTRELLQAIVPIGVAILVSTTLTIVVVALVQQSLENRAKPKQKPS